MLESKIIGTMGITSIDNEKVEIKIPLRNGSFWEKEYNKSDLIQQLIDDFKEENNEDIPEEYMNNWKLKNVSFQGRDEIRALLPNEEKLSFIISQRVQNIVLGDETIPDFIGKPFSDPFEICVFHKSDKSLKIQKYDYKTVSEKGLNNYDSSSAYCNGNNNLFISGGEKKDGNIVAKFWKINLESQEVEDFPMPPKKKHSMIYIQGGYIFIVGGNDKKTYFFDEQNNQICQSSDLNNNRIEPALILVSENLYCFDNINSKNSDEPFTCEKLNLSEDSPKWVLITPIIDSSITNQKMNQKFFGVVKTSDNNVLFLGGNMDENQEGQNYNYKYVIEDNVIEPSDVPFKEYNLKEKTFLTFKKDIEYILPDFNRFHPEVLFFQKNKNKLSLLIYEPKPSKSKANDFPNIEHKFNFNMPKLPNNNNFTEKVDINIDKNIKNNWDINLGANTGNNREINIDIGKPTLDIQKPSFNINNESKNKFDIHLPNKHSDEDEEKIFTNGPNNINIDVDLNKGLNGIGGIPSPDFDEKIGNANINGNLDFGGRINIEGPEINPTDINLPQTEVKPPKITIDESNIKVPGIKVDASIERPNIDFSNKNPNILLDDIIRNNEGGNIGINNLDLNFNKNIPQIDIKGPNIDTNLKSPNFGLEGNTPKIDISGPKFDTNLKGPNFDLEGNIPKIDIKGPNIDASIKRPNFDLEGNIPKTDIKGPNIDTNLKGSNYGVEVNIPKVDIKGPNIDTNLKSPNFDMEGNIPNIDIKGPKFDTNLKSPNFDMEGNIPNVDIKGPKIDTNLKAPNMGLKGNIPEMNFNGPNINMPSGNVDLKGPEINKIDLNGNLKPKIIIPKIDLKKEFFLEGIIKGTNSKNNKINMKTDYNLSGIIPGIKKENINLKVPDAKANANLNLKNSKKNDMDSYMSRIINPNIKVKEKAPGIEIKGPRLNIPSPDINANNNINISGSIPGFEGPKMESKKIDIDYNKPNIQLPSGNININGTKIKSDNDFSGIIPGINVNAPKIDGPKFNVNKPGMNVKINSPNVDIEGDKKDFIIGNIPELKVSGTKIDGPKFDMNGHGMDVKINAQKVDIKGNKDEIISGTIPGIKSGKVDLNGPNININAPNAKVNMKEPNINVKMPNINVKAPKAYINERESYISGILPGINDVKTSNINLPSGKFDIEGPKINTDINGNVPNINAGKFEGPKVDLNLNGDKIKIPDIKINSNLNGNMDGKMNLKGINPKANISSSSQKVSIIAGSINNYNDYILSGFIPSKNDKNGKIIIDNNINANGDINNKLNTKNKLNFHGNLNDINLDLGEVKGQRKFKDINLNNDIDYDIKMSQNKMKISGNNFSSEPFNANNLLNQVNIPNDLNLDIKKPNINVEFPEIKLNTDNKMDIKNSNNIEIGGGEIGGGINLSKNNDENKFGININIDEENKGIDIDTNINNDLRISSQEDKNKENKNTLNNGAGIKRSIGKLPMVGKKDKDFISSKIAEAGKFDGGNINIDISKTANVGINGQKIGDRIEY